MEFKQQQQQQQQQQQKTSIVLCFPERCERQAVVRRHDYCSGTGVD